MSLLNLTNTDQVESISNLKYEPLSNYDVVIYEYMTDVYELRAVQTGGPTTPGTCLLRAGPFYQFGQKMRVRKEDIGTGSK